MVWPFSKSKKPSGLPQKLPFKSGADFLEYQCKFGHTKIVPKQGIVALVLGSQKEFGTAAAVKVDPNGIQTATLKVASEDGGFIVAKVAPAIDMAKPDFDILCRYA